MANEREDRELTVDSVRSIEGTLILGLGGKYVWVLKKGGGGLSSLDPGDKVKLVCVVDNPDFFQSRFILERIEPQTSGQ